MRLRPAAEPDVAALHAIVERAYSPYVPRIGMRPGPMDEDLKAPVAEGRVSVIDDDDGTVVGLIVLATLPDHVLIENVAVEPARHGEGIGRALLTFAETHARERGLRETRLYTHVLMVENLALYARLGYVEDERREEHGFARAFLSKRLT